MNLLVGLATAVGDSLHKDFVDVFHHLLNRCALIRIPGTQARPHERALSAANGETRNAQFLERTTDGKLSTHNTNRPGERVLVGIDAICAGTNVVPARRRNASHRNHNRLGGFQIVHGVPDEFTCERATTAGVDAKYDALHRLGLGERSQCGDKGSRGDFPACAKNPVATSIDNAADGIDNGNVVVAITLARL